MARRGAECTGAPSKVSRSMKLPRAESNPVSAHSGNASATTQLLSRATEACASASSASGLLMLRTIPVPRFLEPLANRVGRFEPEALDLREVVSAIGLSVRLRSIPFDPADQDRKSTRLNS